MLATASLLCVAAGLVAGGLTFAVTRQPRVALPVVLDFFLAAGLIRLGSDASPASLLVVAGVLALRVLVLVGRGRSPLRPSGAPG